MNRRVVVTGIGTVHPCGVGKDNLWKAACEGKSGISLKQESDIPTLPIHAAGFIRDFQPTQFIAQRKSLKVMCRDIQMAVVASMLAREDAKLTPEAMQPTRSGVCIGAGIFEHDAEEMSDCFRAALTDKATFDARKFGSDGMGMLFPLWLLKYLPNMPACHITITHNLQGPSNTLTADSGGAASAIEEAVRIIQRGTADLMYTGGAECRLYGQGLLRYYTKGFLKNGQTPDTAYPIFSKDASGMVMGEGGTILILEELEHALKRNAPIYAEIKGFFMSADGGAGENPLENNPQSLNRLAEAEAYTIGSALKSAGIDPQAIESIHLSAKGILEEDQAESLAIQKTFDASTQKPVLVSTKGLTGFMGYAAAPTEIALAVLSIHEKTRIPSLVGKEPFLSEDYRISSKIETEAPQKHILVNHFEAGSTHHAFVLSTPGEPA